MLTVLGEALIDLVPAVDGRYDARPGGSPLNVAVGLARLGHPTRFMARISTDGFGRRLATFANDNGVLLDHARRVEEASTLAIASLDEHGRADYDFYVHGTADWQWTAADFATLPPTTLLHTGSLASWIQPGAEVIASLLERLRARDDVLLSYDPNVRAPLLPDRDVARGLVERNVRSAHIVKCSEDDLSYLYPGEPVDAVIARWAEFGALVAVTRGSDGVTARHGDELLLGRSLPIGLVDTIGAGDAFMSGLLAGLVERAITDPRAMEVATADDVRAALDVATLVAALTCEKPGAQPPTRREFDAAAVRLA